MREVWPEMEVMDLTCNKLNDFEELTEMLRGVAFRRSTIKIMAVKGN